MLRVIDRTICSHAALLKNNHVRRTAHTAVASSVSLRQPQSSVHKTNERSMYSVLQRLEYTLSLKGRANVDEVLKNLSSLHSLKAVIPQFYFIEAAEIFVAKNDATRLELLIHICRDNSGGVGEKVDKTAFQSRPSDDPLDKLVSNAISGLFANGNKDDASKLWVRMSNSGYVTSRVSIESMIDQVASSSDFSPSLDLLNSLHSAMKAHLWHQSPQYYAKTLNMIRRYLVMSGGDGDALLRGEAALESMWLDACQTLLVSPSDRLPVELHALRLHCYAAAAASAQATSRCSASTELSLRFSENAAAEFNVLLERTVVGGGALPSQEASVAKIADEIAQILSAYKYDSPAQVANSATVSGAAVPGGHFSLYTNLGHQRRSSRLFLKQVADQGQPLQALELFKNYVANHLGAFPDGASSRASSGAGQSGFVDELQVDKDRNRDRASTPDLDASRAAVIAALSSRSLFGTNVALTGASSLNPPREAAAKQYTAEEKAWQAETACEILRSANVALPLLSRFDPVEGVSFEYQVFKELEKVFVALKEVLLHYQLKPGAKFYASYIDALSHNMQFLSDLPSRPTDIAIPWQASLAVARSLLDGAELRVADSAEVYHSLIHLLCQGSRNPDPDPVAVLRALELIHNRGDEKHLVFPATLATLLEAATTSLDDQLLSRVLIELEHLLHAASSTTSRRASGGKTSEENVATVLSARIYAHCRLREGYRALHLMRALRTLGGRLPLSLYKCIVSSLYHSVPVSQWAKDVQANPTATVEYLIGEMKRDKHDVDSDMVSLFVQLYAKVVKDKIGKVDVGLANMDKFLKQCRSRTGVLGTKVISVDAQIVRELVKAHCLAGRFSRAKEIAEQSETMYGVKPTAALFEPIIFKLAALNGQITEAEDIVLQLLNKGLHVTPAIVGSIVTGYLQHRESRDALDCLQDMHNLHGVSPMPAVWTMLLDASLSAGDVMEARRVVSFLRQMHSAEEREQLIGARGGKQFSGALTEETTAARAKAAFVDSMRAEDVQRQEAVFSYWNPLSYFKFGASRKAAPAASAGANAGAEGPTEQEKAAAAPSRRVPIRHDVPVGQRERGVLSDSALEKRFLRFGHSLN